MRWHSSAVRTSRRPRSPSTPRSRRSPDMEAFHTQGDPTGAGEVAPIGVGMLGYAFMGKAHANAYRTLSYMTWPPPLRPELVAIAGRNEQAVAEAGKHIICEKPLGRDAAESYETWQRVRAAGVKHMCAFNYRFVPAVRLARQIVESGDVGEIHHFRASYLQDWGATTEEVWRFDKAAAGSGALGDLAAHVVDLARYLVGEVEAVSAFAATFQPGREVDDAVEAAVAFEGGAVGTIEATRFATGRKNALRWELNGSQGSIAFDLERLNELQVHFEGSSPGAATQGFRTVLVTEADHPFWALCLP